MSAVDRIVKVLEGIPTTPDTAAQTHVACMQALLDDGYSVIPEYSMPYAGKDRIRMGRIDIVAERDGQKFAIEIDARKPRKGSLKKLRQFKGWRILALRGVSGKMPEDIDAVAKLPVCLATQEEIADKRTVAKIRGVK